MSQRETKVGKVNLTVFDFFKRAEPAITVTILLATVVISGVLLFYRVDSLECDVEELKSEVKAQNALYLESQVRLTRIENHLTSIQGNLEAMV